MKNCLVSPKKLCCQISTKNFFDFGTGKYLGRVNILNLDKKWLFYLLKSNGKSNNYSWGGRFGFLIACRDILKLISRFDRSLNLLSDAELHSVDQKSMDPDELVIGSEVPIDWGSFVWIGPVGMDQGTGQDGLVSVAIFGLDRPVGKFQIGPKNFMRVQFSSGVSMWVGLLGLPSGGLGLGQLTWVTFIWSI